MSTNAIVLLIAVIVSVDVLVFALLLGRSRRRAAALRDALVQSGEIPSLGPETAVYQGGGAMVSTKTYGVIALTDRRIIFQQPVGGNIEVPLDQITGLSEGKWFKGNYRSGKTFLILRLRDGQEMGFVVSDHNRWMEELAAKTGVRPSAEPA